MSFTSQVLAILHFNGICPPHIYLWRLIIELDSILNTRSITRGMFRCNLWGETLGFLSFFYTTVVRDTRCDHYDNRSHTDAPLSSELRFLRRRRLSFEWPRIRKDQADRWPIDCPRSGWASCGFRTASERLIKWWWLVHHLQHRWADATYR